MRSSQKETAPKGALDTIAAVGKSAVQHSTNQRFSNPHAETTGGGEPRWASSAGPLPSRFDSSSSSKPDMKGTGHQAMVYPRTAS